MTPIFVSTPNQFTIVESLIFDLTGLSLSIYEFGGCFLALAIINVLFAAPLGHRNLNK